MKKFMRIASILLGMVLANVMMTSCEKDDLKVKGRLNIDVDPGQMPHGWIVEFTGDGSYIVYAKDTITHRMWQLDWKPSLLLYPGGTISVNGEAPIAVAENDTLYKEVKASNDSIIFSYTLGVINTVVPNVTVQVYVGDEMTPISLGPLCDLYIDGDLMLNRVNTTPKFTAESQTKYNLETKEGLKLCDVTQDFVVNGNEGISIVSKKFSWKHIAWKAPVVNGNSIALVCDNLATVSATFSNGMEYDFAKDYKVTNNYQVQGLQNVTFPVSVKHNSYDFNNGTVTVAGNVINIIHQGDVVDNIIIDAVNYKDSVDVCKATPQQISFNNDDATITFVDEEGERVIVNFDVDYQSEDDEEEEVTLIGVTKSFEHMAFRQNATVSGNQISLICDNIATFVSNYSNGTASSPAHVDYTVTNRYNVAIGTLSTEYVGTQATFTHNGNGVYTATIGGVNVTLNYQGTTVANIIYNGVNYKNNAPQCSATPTQVALISASQARITFKHVKVDGTVEVITATVAVTTQTPTTAIDFTGQVVKAYVTLSYTSNMSTTPEAWFHVLVNNNGSYKIYSALWQNGLNVSSFAQTSITATQYNTLIANLNDGEGIAKVYHHYNNGATAEIGTVKGQQYSYGAWKISYYNLGHNLENVVDFSAQTFSGYNGENPIKAVRSGAGPISHNGTTLNIQ
jgi:hypothetical protein